jgi:hypothetical protein
VLKSIDVLIGLTVVLLALSMGVTVITQSITTLFNSRGRHLRRGLTDLLQQLDPALTAPLSKAVATAVLTHPLVSGSNTPVAPTRYGDPVAKATAWWRRIAGGPRLGNVVHREEFTKLLIGLAGAGPTHLEPAASAALKTALASNGIENPEATLKSIRSLALQLERASPELSNMARQNVAILHAAESDLVAKVNSWFDQTMDRTSQRFTASTRAITFAGAFIVAFGLQVDTPLVVNRLAADDVLRAAFVQQGTALRAAQQAAPASLPESQRMDREYRAFLAENGIIKLPSAGDNYWDGYRLDTIGGMLVTTLLLSLGAPFWYSALDRLLQLRSVLAAKDDAQRTERQLNPLAGSTGGTRPAPSTAAGERGDLTAVG